ncbi:unnamed protein product [Cyclocybe aegerita]|uniref:Uncharacterized protein n=1 Tax=Cyclocybe aegerita TaxID=1973307 RepID=A0A8S0VZX9_CYCAE|nr:unnamed protein product [Cyclocybe aegerita]
MAFTTVVSACEGECISGITNALLGNYTAPMTDALSEIAQEIVDDIIHSNRNYPAPPLSYLSPLIDEYNKRAYDHMVQTVFKGYFHGKCQNPTTNIDPPGCPNPDCPVVCGTPGSIVHFYSKFRYLAFDSTCRLMDEIIDPSSEAYQKVNEAVMADAGSSESKRTRRPLRFIRRGGSEDEDLRGELVEVERREDQLVALLRQFCSKLTVLCGGTESGQTNGLPFCSWEESFKRYILTFP